LTAALGVWYITYQRHREKPLIALLCKMEGEIKEAQAAVFLRLMTMKPFE